MKTTELRIYVACLAAYNNGHLHGQWIDATQDSDSLHEEVINILATSPIKNAEEWAIHDNEGFGDCHISEYTSLKTIAELAEFISEHDELGAAILGHTGNNIEEARNVIEEQYHGEFSSEEDFAYYWIHEVDCREIPEYLQHYIDYKSMAQDWFMSDFFSLEVNSKVHVFSH